MTKRVRTFPVQKTYREYRRWWRSWTPDALYCPCCGTGWNKVRLRRAARRTSKEALRVGRDS